MKEIPVIQPYAPAAEPLPSGELRTASIVNDPERLAALRPQNRRSRVEGVRPEIPVNIYELRIDLRHPWPTATAWSVSA